MVVGIKAQEAAEEALLKTQIMFFVYNVDVQPWTKNETLDSFHYSNENDLFARKSLRESVIILVRRSFQDWILHQAHKIMLEC